MATGIKGLAQEGVMQKTVSNVFFNAQQSFEFVQYFMQELGCHFDGWHGGVKHGDGAISLDDSSHNVKEYTKYLRHWRVSGARVEIDVDDEGALFLMYAGGPHGTIDEIVERYIRKYCGMGWGG